MTVTGFSLRPQRGSLADSLAEARAFGSRDELQRHLAVAGHGEIVEVKPYPHQGAVDPRIGWQTHIVTTKDAEGVVVVGFTNGPC